MHDTVPSEEEFETLQDMEVPENGFCAAFSEYAVGYAIPECDDYDTYLDRVAAEKATTAADTSSTTATRDTGLDTTKLVFGLGAVLLALLAADEALDLFRRFDW